MIIFQLQTHCLRGGGYTSKSCIVEHLLAKYGFYNIDSMFEFDNLLEEEIGVQNKLIDSYELLLTPFQKVKNDMHYSNSTNNSLGGVFSYNRLIKNTSDFSFTFIIHPISNFYLSYRQARAWSRQIKQQPQKRQANYAISTWIDQFNSIEEYTDAFITNSGKFTFTFNHQKLTLIDDIFKCSKMTNHNFYGIADTLTDLEISFKKLSKFLDMDLDTSDIEQYIVTNTCAYRQDELANLLKEDVIFHQQKVNILRGAVS